MTHATKKQEKVGNDGVICIIFKRFQFLLLPIRHEKMDCKSIVYHFLVPRYELPSCLTYPNVGMGILTLITVGVKWCVLCLAHDSIGYGSTGLWTELLTGYGHQEGGG